MENTYWSQNGTYQADYNRLIELMPPSGKSDKVAGELIRCASRLGHELYNNGMGNNSSGAVNMLKELGAIDRQTHKVIHPMTRGRLYNGHYNGDLFQMAVESAVEQNIKFILDNPGLETKENDVDMFDYEDEMEHYCEECDEVADGVWGSLCSICEEYQEQMEEDYV